jgi:vitamin B12 transporter
MRSHLLRGAALFALFTPAALHARQDPVELDTLLVTTSTPVPRALAELGNHVTVIGGAEIRTRGITRVEDALRAVSGVNLVRLGSYGGTTSIFMRGAESDQVQVLIDGVPINQPGGSIDLGGLTVENIERIEVARGPSSALTGSDALAGVVHIVTKAGRGDVTGRVFARGGTFGRADAGLQLSGGSETAGFSLAATRYRTDGVLAFNNEHENTVLSGRVDLRPDDRTTLRVTANLSDREFHFPTDGSGNLVDVNQFTFQDRAALALDVHRDVAEGVGLRLLITSTDEETGTDDQFDDEQDTGSFTSLAAFRRLGADLRADIDLGTSTLTVGGEYEEQDVRDFSEFVSDFGTSVGRSENERQNLAAYAHWSGSIGPVMANAGGRLEDNEYFGRFGTWSVGAALPLSRAVRVRGAMGRGIKEPTFPELFSSGFTTGNPELDPEESLSWEIGGDARVGPLEMRATFFDQAIDNLIQYTGGPASPSDPNFFNVAEASTRGLELEAATRLGPVDVDGTWTWLDTEVVDAGFDSGPGATFVEGERLIRRPDQTLGVGASVSPATGVRISTRLDRVGDRDDRDFSTFPATPVTLGAYTLVDAAVSYVLAPASATPLEFTLRGENLLDEDYAGAFGFRAPGRAVTLGVTASFGN